MNARRLTAPTENASPFQVRAIIEGFYGTYYTAKEREGLIVWAAKRGFNTYIYGPKMDPRHRERWWEPYPSHEMRDFARAVELAQGHGMRFHFGISCGEDIQLSSEKDLERVFTKLKSFHDIGVRDFHLLFDDIPDALEHRGDRVAYDSCAEAHADFANRVLAQLAALDPSCTLTVCPTHYAGSAPFHPYVRELGDRMNPEIDVHYTGPEICVSRMASADAASFAHEVSRKPVFWDNWPVNDGTMRARLHIGPLRGREETLYESVRGIAVNPMVQAEASKIPLSTYADYLKAPHNYSPEESWERALVDIAGEAYAPALKLFAETSLYSCVDPSIGAPRLSTVTTALLEAGKEGRKVTGTSEAAAFLEYLSELHEACHSLAYHLPNEALRRDILPWVETLTVWIRASKRAMRVLDALENGEDVTRPLKALEMEAMDARRRGEQIGAPQLEPLLEWVFTRAGRAKQQGTGSGHELPVTLH